MTSAVVDHLRASGHFSMVSMYTGRPDLDYIFSGKLEKLEEVDYEGGGVKVEVAMSAQIVSVATGATVWSNAVSEVGTVSRRTVPGVVSQMNQTMEQAINKLLSNSELDAWITDPNRTIQTSVWNAVDGVVVRETGVRRLARPGSSQTDDATFAYATCALPTIARREILRKVQRKHDSSV